MAMPPLVTVKVGFPQHTLDALDRRADAFEISRAEAVRRAVKRWLGPKAGSETDPEMPWPKE